MGAELANACRPREFPSFIAIGTGSLCGFTAMTAVLPSFLTAEWRHLLMLNYEIDPQILTSRIPAGTELDLWNGKSYVSMVGFRFLNTRLRGIAIPFHRNFSEVNLRFYVRRKTGNEWRRGVVFIKEIVPLPCVALVARWVYNENYVTLPMRDRIDMPAAQDRGLVTYSWKWQGVWTNLSAEIAGASAAVAPGSEEEFITEHYWGYTTQRDGSSIEYAVEHPQWRIWPTTSSRFECDVSSLYGAEFVDALTGKPNSAFVADGSEIVVRQGTRSRLS